MNPEKAKYFNDKIVSCAGNQSILFKTVDEFLHGKVVQSLPAHNNIHELAYRFSWSKLRLTSYSLPLPR